MNIEFREFFGALWNCEPFPWQTMLARRVLDSNQGWPAAIKLPTASGKTACIDIALFALAEQAKLPLEKRTAPRRIFFVVDRRIVVDEAFHRASEIAKKLHEASNGVLKEIAERLRLLSGFEKDAPPLAVARLRGGVWRDDGWARMPTQPAIITSTVDQLGSRLLFRSYGGSDSVTPIHAALAANDSLILLDEAHCAQPFMQTLQAIEKFRGGKWAEMSLGLPFHFVIMSATPPHEIEQSEIFPRPNEADAALAHDVLQKRINALKAAELVECRESIVAEAAVCARECVAKSGRNRVAVMVNRVQTAAEIAAELERDFSRKAEIILLTGRMRSFDRDHLVAKWAEFLKADKPKDPKLPIILVTTQCLEVGADFSFDALITECASLDALRQRFGRLNRFGDVGSVTAAILISKADAKSKAPDPIYGDALKKTWEWLNEVAIRESKKAVPQVDFGIAAMNRIAGPLEKDSPEKLRVLLAPTDDAPVLLPAHLDLFSQTSPPPDPEPDASLFLHGKRGGAPEVSVVWRADLASLPREDWADSVALLPPSAGEVFRIPLPRFLQWVRSGDAAALGDVADVEGEEIPPGDEQPRASRSLLLWRGVDKSRVSNEPRDIKPGLVIVLPLDEKEKVPIAVGQLTSNGAGPNRADLAERVFFERTGKAALRVHCATLAPWKKNEAIRALLDALEDIADEEDAGEKFREFAARLEAKSPAEPDAEPVPGWLRELIAHLAKNPIRIDMYPGGGFVITTRRAVSGHKPVEEEDFFADESELLSLADKSVPLADHTAQVIAVAQKIASRCIPAFAQLIERCARLHDIGKLDERFQIVLQNGDELAARRALEKCAPLAKSEKVTLTPSRRRAIRESARLPETFRHEMLSAHLSDALGLIDNGENRELALHLIECHHGFARPFAPVARDANPPALDLAPLGIARVFSSEERAVLPPAGQLDSGVAERFWKLTRRFGWWGLAYLEAMLRLADWHASRHAREEKSSTSFAGLIPRAATQPRANRSEFLLAAIDGANPLGYLAALGAFRLATRVWPERRVLLGWERIYGVWRPLLRIEPALAADEQSAQRELVNALHKNGVQLADMFAPELLQSSIACEKKWKDKLRFTVAAYRDFCQSIALKAAPSADRLAEFAATWGGETDSEEHDKRQLVKRTRFDFTAGQQSFIAMLRDVRRDARSEDVGAALFTGWRYSIAASSMRWDPVDEKRQYALQASDPTDASANPSIADPGANFLAIDALPLFPFVPDRRASQPGFERDSEGRSWTWALWRDPATLDVIRTFIATVSSTQSDDAEGERPATCARFQSAIVMPSGRYRCFTRPRAL